MAHSIYNLQSTTDGTIRLPVLQAGYESEGSEGEEEEDLKKTEWMGNNPPYAEAVEYEEMVGLTSYKISKNPRYLLP